MNEFFQKEIPQKNMPDVSTLNDNFQLSIAKHQETRSFSFSRIKNIGFGICFI